MIKEIIGYTIACDKCGKIDKLSIFHTEQEALLATETVNRWFFITGQLICPECISRLCNVLPENEEWRSIPGIMKYEVSSFGRIRKKRDGKILLQRENNKTGYYRITLYGDNNKATTRYVHRLVAEAFCYRGDGCDCVDHIDTDKKNNIATNLRWVNRSENNLNKITVERNRASKIGKHCGGRHSKRFIQYDSKKNIIREWSSVDELCKKTDFKYNGVTAALRGYRKTYKGFIWVYK